MASVFRARLKPLAVALHRALARFGVHVLPKHHYSSFADLHDLRASLATWAHPSKMPGVRMPMDAQLAFLQKLCRYFGEVDRDRLIAQIFSGAGEGLPWPDATVLHGFVRHTKPQRVVEVGGGMSTSIIQEALRLNGRRSQHTAVEPYPSRYLRDQKAVHLIPMQIQELDLPFFDQLSSGDLLFIDSSHVVKPASDVNYLILEVLPRLRDGVAVHFHDITFPYDYQIDLLDTFYQWSESSLLHAFLINNCKCQVTLCMSFLHHCAPDQLRCLLPQYRPARLKDGLVTQPLVELRQGGNDFAGSTYLRIGAESAS